MLCEDFKNGINLGGWLSQYEFLAEDPNSEEGLRAHFEAFITEEDIKRIRAWGFDHVRLPLSGYLLFDQGTCTLRPIALEQVHRCIEWCAAAGLNVVVDLHDFYGNVYGAMNEPMPLLADAELREQLVVAWRLIARELKDVEAPTLMFELLNEVSDASGAYDLDDPTGLRYDEARNAGLLWNSLAGECLAAIREVDPDRLVLVGSNGQNSVAYLKQLHVFDDPRVVFGFHYYDPQAFTHQRASFSDEMCEYGQEVTYPGSIQGFSAYLKEHPAWRQKHALTCDELVNDRALMEKLLGFAFDFKRRTGAELYCGEFGVIGHAPGDSARRWAEDFTSILDSHGIGHALWTYKSLDFGLLDLAGNPASSLLG